MRTVIGIARLLRALDELRAERGRTVHRFGSAAHNRQEGELNALNMVERYIKTGSWS